MEPEQRFVSCARDYGKLRAIKMHRTYVIHETIENIFEIHHSTDKTNLYLVSIVLFVNKNMNLRENSQNVHNTQNCRKHSRYLSI